MSDGTIIIRDQDKQTQNVSDLSRDVEHANQTLSPIFDKEKEQKRLQQAQLIGEIGNQAMDIARTEGAITATKAAKEKMNNVTDTDRKAAADKLAKDKPGEVITAEDINAQIYQTAYNKAFSESGYGTGGKVQQGMQAAVAAVQGLAGGDLQAAIAGGAAPYLAEQIHRLAPNEESRIIAHAVVAGALAELQGQSAAAGAAGAATAALGTKAIAEAMFGTSDFSKMSEEQRQTVSALATLAGGLAGGLASGDTAGAVTGGQSGKNTSENNDQFDFPIPPAVQQDASLASWMAQQGTGPEAIDQAVKDSHLGPSFGVTYKVKPYGKVEAAVGAGYGLYVGGTVDTTQISLNQGETLALGGRVAGQIGVQLGPYFANTLDMERNNSLDFGFGIAGVGISYGKDGVGLSLGVGPAIGWTGISKETGVGNVDMNGSSGTEFYHHDFDKK